MRPSSHVLDLFAVPDDLGPVPGAGKACVRAGDLVLTAGHDPVVQDWLRPVMARFAYGLDQEPLRRRQDLRVAMPVPARDGSWVVEGWTASRYEPGTVACTDPGVVRAAGHLLHARLASLVPVRPRVLDARTDRVAVAERVASGEENPPSPGSGAGAVLDLEGARLVAAALAVADPGADLGGSQLVHARLAGNVLLDGAGAPVVIDVVPAWRPARWANAVCVLDTVLTVLDAVPARAAGCELLEPWTRGPARTAMARAIVFRALSGEDPMVAACADVLAVLGPGTAP